MLLQVARGKIDGVNLQVAQSALVDNRGKQALAPKYKSAVRHN